MKWPIKSKNKLPKSRTLRGFGSWRKGRRIHCGTDLLAKYGSDVFSIEEGIVKNIFLFTYPKLDPYHKYENTWAIAIKHADGNYALYCEIQKPKLKIGIKVREGQIIAKVDRIFLDKPSHTMLHFEYHSRLPKKTTKWYVGKRPNGLLSSTKYLVRIK
jgi:murein DD-endopeptidase MepM/ murein hydrolase activator NlpD